LATGDVAAAAKLYGALLKRRDSVDQVIEDLRVALERSPDVAVLWQILGDAYMRVDRTGEALEAYRRGMEAG
jgi:cytochrome c-type biogenesis protein CcmH/NrfG